MAESTLVREVEAKFRITDVEALLVALKTAGVELGGPIRQDDQAYAPAAWEYGQPKQGVPFARLRTVNGQHTFTVKVPQENALSVAEHETVVADREQMHAAVLAMGMRPTVRIAKARRVGTLPEGTQVCVDEVDGLGAFVELERIVPAGADGEAVQAELAAWVARLGVPAERTTETYDSLLHRIP